MTSIPNLPEEENPSRREPRTIDLDGPLPLILHIDSAQEQISPITLGDSDRKAEIVNRARDAGVVTCDLGNLLSWAARDRQIFLRFCYTLHTECESVRFLGPGAAESTTNLFQAVLAAIRPADDPEACERAINGATEAAALWHPDAIRPACNRIIQVIRRHGLTGYRVDQLYRGAQEFLDESDNRDAGSANPYITDIWSDAPAVEGMILPPGWLVDERGIRAAGTELAESIPARIVISRRLRNTDTDTTLLEISWSRSDQWQRRCFPKAVLASTRTIVSLADYDIPVTSNNAPELIAYLFDFETENLDLIPEATASDRMGWIGTNGDRGFLMGTRLISDIHPPETDVDECQQAVVFRGADDGDQQLADALRQGGSYEGWVSFAERLRPFPAALLVFYASFAPPLHLILRSSNFVVSLAGTTSGGKTTALIAAAATWGCPDDQPSSSLIQTWDTTRVGRERSMQILNDLPFVIDDTKLTDRPEDVAQAIYDVAGGHGRTRGSVRGLAATGSWRTGMITSGEQPLASHGQDGGGHARVLETWGTPFGQISSEMAQIVSELEEGFSEHFGHAGKRFVYELIVNRTRWGEWRELYRTVRRQYVQRATNNVAARMAGHLAALDVGARLVHELLTLPWPYEDTISGLWEELTRESAEADRAEVAMRCVLNFCHAQRHRFIHRAPGGDAPHGGYLGVWRHETQIDGGHECLAVYLNTVKDVLRGEGFEPNSMKRMWKDRGWVTTNPQKTTLKIRPPGSDVALETVAIRVDVIDELLNNDAPPTPPRDRGAAVGRGIANTRTV